MIWFIIVYQKKKNFYIKLSDKDFFSLINNNYFNEHLNIEIDNLLNEIIPKIPLIKNNKLTEEILNILKNIFFSFSFNEKLTHDQASISNKIISDLFYCGSDKDEYLSCWENYFDSFYETEDESNSMSEITEFREKKYLTFEGFWKFYYKRIKSDIDKVWKSLYNLGYNNLLKQNESCIDIQDHRIIMLKMKMKLI